MTGQSRQVGKVFTRRRHETMLRARIRKTEGSTHIRADLKCRRTDAGAQPDLGLPRHGRGSFYKIHSMLC